MRILYKNDRFKAYLNNPKELAKDYPPAVVKAVPKRLKAIKKAKTLRELADDTGCLEKLKGKRKNQYRLELDGQFRLIFEVVNTKPLTAMIIEIIDYHGKRR